MASPLFDETRESFLSATYSLTEEVFSRLDKLRLSSRELVHTAIVVCREPMSAVLGSLNIRHKNIRILSAHQSGEVGRFEMRRTWGAKTHRQQVEGTLFVLATEYRDTFLILCVEPSRFWHDLANIALERSHPKIIRPFFTQRELERLLENVNAKLPEAQLRVLRTSTRERLRAAEARKRFASSIRWTDTDVSTAFAEARQENYWFRTLAFDIARNSDGAVVTDDVSGSVSKNGYVNCTDRFRLFLQSIIRPMVDLAHHRIGYFSDRDRKSSQKFVPKPLTISYETEIFSSTTQIRKLLDILRALPNATCSVLHGNPYLHVSMVDNYDYSSADVWVLAKNEILIIPQIKTSEAAIKRFVNHIFENFMEGSIGDENHSQAAIQ